MDAGAQASRDIVSEHCATQQDLFLPAHELAYHLAEGGVLKEAEVVRVRVGCDHFLDCFFVGRKQTSADAGVIAGVLGRVEDTVFG